MKTIQIVLDKKLLHTADQAARRTKRNRSALVHDALREHLRRDWSAALKKGRRRGQQNSPRQDSTVPVCPARQKRPVVVLTRDSSIAYLATVTIAPITSEAVLVGEDGMKAPCAVNLHNAVTVLRVGSGGGGTLELNAYEQNLRGFALLSWM
jgi:Ribbon-helix-helix protein, copG family